jgi:hypothetical protein
MAFRVVQGCGLVQRRDGNGVQYRLSVLDSRYMHYRCTFDKRCVSRSSGQVTDCPPNSSSRRSCQPAAAYCEAMVVRSVGLLIVLIG